MQWLCPASFMAPHRSPHHNQSGLVFLHLRGWGGGLGATEDTSTLSLKAFLLPLIVEPQPHWSQSCSLNMEGTLYRLASPTFPLSQTPLRLVFPPPGSSWLRSSVVRNATWTALYLDSLAFLLTDLFTFLRAEDNCSAGCRHPIKAGYAHT